MKKTLLLLQLSLSLVWFTNSCNQSATTERKMSVEERMVKARTTKAEKRASGLPDDRSRVLKATPADYKSPVDKVLKGPNGEVVRTGENGGKYYINKNGNKTYLSSNQ